MTIDSDFTPWPDNFQRRYKNEHYWLGEPLGNLLRHTAQAAKERTAIIVGDKRWSYRQLDEKADQLAASFKARGIHSGARVVVQLPNCGELFEILFALFRVGAVPILALPTHRYAEISYFSGFAEAVAYITTDQHAHFDYRDIARTLRENLLIQQVIVVGDAAEFTSLTELYQPPLDSPYINTTELPNIDAAGVALFQLSGGTTGTPKLIPRTHNDYYYSIRASALICALRHSSVYLAVLPVVHNFPLSSPGALGVLWVGGTLVLANSGAPDVAFPLIEQHKVTITAMVPPLALAWLSAYENLKQAGTPPNFKSLEFIQVGGAKFSEESARRITPVLGCKLQQVFGMAEGLVNYTRLNDDLETIVTTQGRPISKADEIRIVDENDIPVAPGETGLLLTRGPYTIRGYFRADEHNAKAFTLDGFYRTGDLVRLTEAGYLVVEGRVKDQINRGGEKIAAEEVENHLLAHPQIHDVALVAMPDLYLGERTCAYVVPRNPDMPPKTTELLRFLHARNLAPYKIPDRVEFIYALPQTRLGKVDKKTLRQMIADKLALMSVP